MSAATTDGDTISSAYRSQFLNDGIRNCIYKWAANRDWMALRHYIKDGTATLSAGASLLTAWTGTPFIIISARNSTDGMVIKPVPSELKHYFDTGEYSNYFAPSTTKQYYSVENGYFTLLDGTGTSTDTIYLRYIKQHTDLTAGAGASTVVQDTDFTSLLTAITNFTGVLSTHVGGRFVGTDSDSNHFDRLITAYVSSTAFTIDSALTADGATGTGYIVPPSQNDIEIDSQYWNEVLQEAFNIFLQRVGK